ncbi:MAG: hypothetical protein ROR55_20780 [Devosia sp.]
MTEPDGPASYTLAVAARREAGVRGGRFVPRNDRERRQAREGERHWSAYDCVRAWTSEHQDPSTRADAGMLLGEAASSNEAPSHAGGADRR